MHQKKNSTSLVYFSFKTGNDFSSSDDSFLQLYEIHLKKTKVYSSCVGSSINFYFINRNGLTSSNGSFLQDTLKKKFTDSNKLRA